MDSSASGRFAATVAAVATALILGGCSSQPPGTEPTPTPAAAEGGVIAMGHSGITGEGATGDSATWTDYSWATGSADEVNSIYSRMVELLPETEGQVANTGAPGSPSTELASEASEALGQVPAPALALIQTIDNDMRCDGTDETHVSEFGQNVQDALDVLSEKSPDSQVLIVSQRGRPTDAAKFFPAAEPVTLDVSDDPCGFVNADGEYVAEKAEYLTSVIGLYEAEQKRVCALYPTCHDDGGVMTQFDDSVEGRLSPDFNHLSIAGQAAVAETLWPIVEELLTAS
jgi:hypothetical protein